LPGTYSRVRSSPPRSSQQLSGKGEYLPCGCVVIGDLVVEAYCSEGERLARKVEIESQFARPMNWRINNYQEAIEKFNKHLRGNNP
jgi:hypothetical protein